MSEKNNDVVEEKKGRSITLRDAFDFVIYNWYWFLLSAVVFGGIGVIYALSTPNTYKSAAMIFVDEEYNRSKNSEITGFMSSKMMYRSNNGVENELLILRSKMLMERVVSRLNANIAYSAKLRFRDQQIKAVDSPVKLIADSIALPYNVKVTLDGTDRFTAVLKYKLPKERKIQEKTINGRFGETVSGVFGKFRLEKNATFEKANFNGDDHLIKISVTTIRRAANRYAKLLTVSQAEKYSNIVYVSMTNQVPVGAAEMVNTLIEEYNWDAINSKRETARATMNFIDERLASVSVELADVDMSIEKFKSKNSAVDIETEAGLSLKNTAEYEDKLLQTEIQLDMIKAIGDILTKSKSLGTLPVNIGIEDIALSNAISRYNELVLDRMRLGVDSSVDNPVIREMNAQIASMQGSLKQSVDNVYSSLLIRRNSIKEQLTLLMGKVNNLPYLERETVSIGRDQEIKATLYAFLLNKREETALTMVATAPVANVIDPAVVNPEHVAPNRSMIVLLFLVIGLILPAVVIYIIEQLRLRVGRISEVENALQIPIIGAIPSKVSGMNGDMIVSQNSRDVITEAFRMVRTNLDFTMPAGGKVIMVTSSLPGEGKSFVSINLSLTLGIAGKRVLLVDLDLRKASLSEKISGKRQTKGLVNYLVRKEDGLDKLISHDAMYNVDVLYVGVIPPNPAELLIGDRITETFDELKKMYDYIVVDTPPVGLVTDTMLINRVADLTVFSVRIGRSLRRNLLGINFLSSRKTLRNLNVIITDIDAGSSYTKDTSTYGYGYGYGYGYQDDKKMTFRTRIKLLGKKLKGRRK